MPNHRVVWCLKQNGKAALVFLHERQITFLGGFGREFKGELSLSWLSGGGGLFDG
jgi:hypothetical protein